MSIPEGGLGQAWLEVSDGDGDGVGAELGGAECGEIIRSQYGAAANPLDGLERMRAAQIL
jgi:hypothetical protein